MMDKENIGVFEKLAERQRTEIVGYLCEFYDEMLDDDVWVSASLDEVFLNSPASPNGAMYSHREFQGGREDCWHRVRQLIPLTCSTEGVLWHTMKDKLEPREDPEWEETLKKAKTL